jgi:hypothetical protein
MKRSGWQAPADHGGGLLQSHPLAWADWLTFNWSFLLASGSYTLCVVFSTFLQLVALERFRSPCLCAYQLRAFDAASACSSALSTFILSAIWKPEYTNLRLASSYCAMHEPGQPGFLTMVYDCYSYPTAVGAPIRSQIVYTFQNSSLFKEWRACVGQCCD